MVNHDRLVQLFAQEEAAPMIVEEQFRSGAIKKEEIDLANLFESCFGLSHFRNCRSAVGDGKYANMVMQKSAMEDARGAASTAAFLNVSKQFLMQAVLDSNIEVETVFQDMIPEKPWNTFKASKMGGITQFSADDDWERPEGDPYKRAAPGENYIYTPPVIDRGKICACTWESIFDDATGQLADRARQINVGYKIDKEKRAVDAFIDQNRTKHRYNWRGTIIETYNENTGNHVWDNYVASNALVDWASINTAEQTANLLIDPFSGNPLNFDLNQLVVTKTNAPIAERLLKAMELRTVTNTNTTTIAGNPYAGKYSLVTSKMLAARSALATDWYLANIAKMLVSLMIAKEDVRQMPDGHPDLFERQIIVGWRVNEAQEFATAEPRAAVKCAA